MPCHASPYSSLSPLVPCFTAHYPAWLRPFGPCSTAPNCALLHCAQLCLAPLRFCFVGLICSRKWYTHQRRLRTPHSTRRTPTHSSLQVINAHYLELLKSETRIPIEKSQAMCLICWRKQIKVVDSGSGSVARLGQGLRMRVRDVQHLQEISISSAGEVILQYRAPEIAISSVGVVRRVVVWRCGQGAAGAVCY